MTREKVNLRAMAVEQVITSIDDKNIAVHWDDAHRFSPAPRHRRRLLLKTIALLDFKNCLDAGCAQLYLLQEIVRRHHVTGYGCDISDQVIASNRSLAPDCNFITLDLATDVWPADRQFDLVLCSEVLEHIPDWKAALRNLARMSRKHLLITVPSGKIRHIDKLVGHHYHFNGQELEAELRSIGFSIKQIRRWGFPFHSLYKILINRFAADQIYASFTGVQYGFLRQLFCNALYLLFYLNGFNSGNQLIVLAQKSSAEGTIKSN
jgi:SAM-dependent methyltransferase